MATVTSFSEARRAASSVDAADETMEDRVEDFEEREGPTGTSDAPAP